VSLRNTDSHPDCKKPNQPVLPRLPFRRQAIARQYRRAICASQPSKNSTSQSFKSLPITPQNNASLFSKSARLSPQKQHVSAPNKNTHDPVSISGFRVTIPFDKAKRLYLSGLRTQEPRVRSPQSLLRFCGGIATLIHNEKTWVSL